MCNRTVDIVITYVDGSDNIYNKLYEKELKKFKKENPTWEITGYSKAAFSTRRTRCFGIIRYLLRSIDKYATWINNVFLVVQSESQVPRWVNRETVNVVLHEEFIPKEYLPTYNSSTINLFIPYIKGLSNFYIKLDDDILLTKPLNETDVYDFSDNLQCKIKCNVIKNQKIEENMTSFAHAKINSTKILNEEFNIEDDDFFYDAGHCINPNIKNDNLYLLSKYFNKIKKTITKYRNSKNLTHYFYLFHGFLRYHEESSIKCKTLTFKDIKELSTVILSMKYNAITINDNNLSDDFATTKKYLEKKLDLCFPKKSKYEINMEEKIDFVVTFVDKTDPEYIERYNTFIKDNEIPIPEINNIEIRANDYGTLKCLLRSIDRYAPWINNVFLVVQSESQVPNWVNKEHIKVITHDMFIPKEYLPTYNTFTLQAHLHLIPGLSEKFISSDDDSILLKPITPEYFFIDDKIVQCCDKLDISKIRGSSSKPSHYFKYNSSEIIKNVLKLKNDFYYQSDHSMHGMFKSLNAEVYDLLGDNKYITPFREAGNIMRNSYFTYAFLKRRVIHIPRGKNGYFDFKNKTIHNFRIWFIENCGKKQMSINDQDINNEFDKNLFYNMVEETIYKMFPNKSKKYEI